METMNEKPLEPPGNIQYEPPANSATAKPPMVDFLGYETIGVDIGHIWDARKTGPDPITDRAALSPIDIVWVPMPLGGVVRGRVSVDLGSVTIPPDGEPVMIATLEFVEGTWRATTFINAAAINRLQL